MKLKIKYRSVIHDGHIYIFDIHRINEFLPNRTTLNQIWGIYLS